MVTKFSNAKVRWSCPLHKAKIKAQKVTVGKRGRKKDKSKTINDPGDKQKLTMENVSESDDQDS